MIDDQHHTVGIAQSSIACRSDNLAHMTRTARTNDKQLQLCSVYRQIVGNAAVHRNHLHLKVGIASPPPGQSAAQLCAYPAITLDRSLRVCVGRLPAGDHPQWGVAQACFRYCGFQYNSVIWRLVDFDKDPVGMGSGWTAMSADDGDRAVRRASYGGGG